MSVVFLEVQLFRNETYLFCHRWQGLYTSVASFL